MAAIHSASTKPELKLRLSLWHLSFRYRVNDKSLPGKPDIVLPKFRTAIFVHGCFWHGHNGCKFYTVPKTNTEFWASKIARNQERDQEVWRQLEAKGWAVIIVWECQLKKATLDETIKSVATEIKRNGENYRHTIDIRKKAQEEYRREQREKKENVAALMSEIKHL